MNSIKELITEFIQSNKSLVEKVPYIEVCEISEWSTGDGEEVFDPPLVEVNFYEKNPSNEGQLEEVTHFAKLDSIEFANIKGTSIYRIAIHTEFIFDKRLILESWKDIEVLHLIHGDEPKEFDPEYSGFMLLEEAMSPERYENFVDNNIDRIRQKLQINRKSEILDALTGDFVKYKQECITAKENYLKQSKGFKFYKELLKKTEIAYNKSDIINHPNNRNWGYAVTSTFIKKNKPLIVGFNWGVDNAWIDKGNTYGGQNPEEYPTRWFINNYRDLGSLKTVENYLNEYCFYFRYSMQTNFCFFRSEKENQISPNDLDLSKSLFEEYLQYAEPSGILSFSSKLRDYFLDKKLIVDTESIDLKIGRGFTKAIKGKYKYNDKKIPFYYIPHPQAHISSEDRERAWAFCFPEKDMELEEDMPF